MDLSNDLISKFVKITNDADKQKSKEGTVYGTAVKYNESIYVRIDGSDLLTPIDTTADIKEGERVTITIKDHNATVTGNITSPSASREDVKKVTKNVEEIEGKITEFEAVIADVVHVGELDAEVARIDELLAGKATMEDLTATNAEITNLKAKDAEIENLVADKATIEDLTATNAEITNLKANKADITYLDANFATIDELEATHANIDILDAEVANINTLVNGNLTSDNILSFNITSKNTTMEDAFIKDAMIDRITANKIMSGVIDTNNVVIQSTDGSMLLQGNILQMKDESGKVRIQIGKDTGGNFTFVLYDESGKGVLIDEEGIKSSDAIADGLIVDAKVADNANISGSKLDIESVITEVNKDNSTTIKSSKIYLDEQNQSLEVAFNSLKSQVETIQDVTINGDLSSIVEQVQSNTTKIEANKEGINTLVAENVIRTEEISDLEGELQQVNTTLSNKYASLEQNLDGFKTTVSDTYTTKTEFNNLSIGGRNLIKQSNVVNRNAASASYDKNTDTWTITANAGEGALWGVGLKLSGTNIRIPYGKTYVLSFEIKVPRACSWNIDVKNFAVTGSSWYHNDNDNSSARATSSKTLVADQWIKCWSRISNTDSRNTNKVDIYDNSNFGVVMQDETSSMTYQIRNIQGEIGNKATEWSPAPEDVQANIDAVDGKFANYSTTTQMNSAINQKANEITSSVSSTYATKSSVTDLSDNLTTNYSTTSAMNSAIDQKANQITNSISSTYATKSSVTDLSDNLTTNYSTTSAMNSAIDQRVDEISSSVSSTYATKSSVTNLNNTLLSNYSTTTQMNSAINQKANQITSSVSTTYATKAEVSELAVIGTNLWVTGDLTCGYVGGDSNNLGKTVAHTNTSQQVRKTLVAVSDCSHITYQCWNPNKVDSSYNGLYLTARIAFFKSDGTCISVTALPVLNGTTYQSLTISVPSNAALVKLAAICGIRNASNSGDNYDDSILIKFEKGSTGTDWSPAPQDTVTMASLDSTIKQTSTEVITSFLEDGFETGIITFDANGIKVEHTATKGWTRMSATGFYVSDGTNDIISATNGNVTITGTIYATAGEIGGYTISGNQLIGTNVGMSGLSGEGHAFWAGNAISGNAPFRVGHNGFLRATNAEITGTINATAGTFSGNVETTNIMKAYGAVYAGTELWGGFTKNSNGVFESRSTFTVSATNNIIVKGSKVYLYPTSGEVIIGDTSSYDNLRARELYAQDIVYTDTLRSRTSSVTGTQNLLVESGNGYVEFGSGYGVVRVAENNHLYLQCGNTSGSSSSEVRCTLYKSSSSYANLRAHNVCAQNAVYAAGVNVSSDRNRKRDIEKYEVDALQEVCSTPVYAYHLDVDKDEEMKRIGIIMQEAPVDAIDLTGKGIDLYQMVSMLWKAVQQLNDKLEG